MSWLPLFALLGLAVSGCADPAEPGAIEVTGYLDASRITFTQLDGEALAVGLDGATRPNATVILANDTTGDEASATASDAGGFVVSVAATDGDHLSLRADDGPVTDEVVHDVPSDHPFPDAAAITATPDPLRPDLAVVEVSFSPGRLDGRVWASNPALGEVVLLDVFAHGTVHGGHLPAGPGAVLVLHWVFDDGTETSGLEVHVTAARR